MEMNKMTRNEKKQRRIRQLKIRVISTLLIFCLVIVAGGCALIEKNKESKKVVRVNGGVVEKTKNVADNSENTSTETKEETSKTEEKIVRLASCLFQSVGQLAALRQFSYLAIPK